MVRVVAMNASAKYGSLCLRTVACTNLILRLLTACVYCRRSVSAQLVCVAMVFTLHESCSRMYG
jgi:hypothetical protein